MSHLVDRQHRPQRAARTPIQAHLVISYAYATEVEAVAVTRPGNNVCLFLAPKEVAGRALTVIVSRSVLLVTTVVTNYRVIAIPIKGIVHRVFAVVRVAAAMQPRPTASQRLAIAHRGRSKRAAWLRLFLSALVGRPCYKGGRDGVSPRAPVRYVRLRRRLVRAIVSIYATSCHEVTVLTGGCRLATSSIYVSKVPLDLRISIGVTRQV